MCISMVELDMFATTALQPQVWSVIYSHFEKKKLKMIQGYII